MRRKIHDSLWIGDTESKVYSSRTQLFSLQREILYWNVVLDQCRWEFIQLMNFLILQLAGRFLFGSQQAAKLPFSWLHKWTWLIWFHAVGLRFGRSRNRGWRVVFEKPRACLFKLLRRTKDRVDTWIITFKALSLYKEINYNKNN